ncbi:alpha/beta fold hydrolase [Streptomyces cellulosae]
MLLPGGSATGLVWYANAPALGRRYRVHAVDLLGDAGRTERRGVPLKGADDLTAWLDALLDGLGLTRTHLCGHSYGAWLAARYALHAPRRVDRLALVDPHPGVRRVPPRLPAARVALDDPPERGPRPGVPGLGDRRPPPGRDLAARPRPRRHRARPQADRRRPSAGRRPPHAGPGPARRAQPHARRREGRREGARGAAAGRGDDAARSHPPLAPARRAGEAERAPDPLPRLTVTPRP